MRFTSRIGTEPSTISEPSGCSLASDRCDVGLVGDVADDLLDDVLERHQAHDLAILVDHDGEMRLALQKGVELVLEVVESGTNQGGVETT